MSVVSPLVNKRIGAVLACVRLTLVSSCDRGLYATVVWRATVNILPESRLRDRVLTSELPKLPGHRKVPILESSVREGTASK
jgi:hypothetical protein